MTDARRLRWSLLAFNLVLWAIIIITAGWLHG